MPWDPATYEKFRDERYAPFVDLCALIEPRPGMRIIDLGCGTAELTARLAELLPAATSSASIHQPKCWARRSGRPQKEARLARCRQVANRASCLPPARCAA